jgi:hypothetical protein
MEQSAQGGLLNGFYMSNRVLDSTVDANGIFTLGDPFWVQV